MGLAETRKGRCCPWHKDRGHLEGPYHKYLGEASLPALKGSEVWYSAVMDRSLKGSGEGPLKARL